MITVSTIRPTVIATSALACILGCATASKDGTASKGSVASGAPNTLSAAEQAAGWQLLFDGSDPSKHLRGYRRGEFPKEWAVEDGCIVLRGKGGDLVTREEYGDFEFACDWKVAPGGNSGIMCTSPRSSARRGKPARRCRCSTMSATATARAA
jgi:hypothetical protein